MAETPRRSFRIPGDRYAAAQKAAEKLETDLSAEVNAALDQLIERAKGVRRRKSKPPVTVGE